LGAIPVNQEMADKLVNGRENIFRAVEGHSLT